MSDRENWLQGVERLRVLLWVTSEPRTRSVIKHKINELEGRLRSNYEAG